MKGFTREETRFSLCGLNCTLCPMRLGGYCPGCGGGAGNQSCAIAKCSLEHGGVLFCWECPEYPCSRYEGFDGGDSLQYPPVCLHQTHPADHTGLCPSAGPANVPRHSPVPGVPIPWGQI